MKGESVAMEPLVIRKEIEIDAPVDTVWPFVATAEGLRRWFLADQIVLEPRPGGRYEEHAVYEGEPHHVVGEVLAYESPRRFVHTYRAQRRDGSYWSVGTVVTITLSAAGLRTHVVVEHRGFEQLPVEYARRAFETYDGGWGHAAERLPGLVRERADWGASPRMVRNEIEIDAPPERIWPYIGTAEGYRRWSCPGAQSHEVTLEPHPGGSFEDRMVVEGRVYHGIGQVVEYDPPRRIVLRTGSVEGHLTSIVDTITITLVPVEDRTRVIVEHAGFEQLPPERQEQVRKIFDQGWVDALAALYGLLVQEVLPALGRLLIYQTIEIAAPAERVWRYIATEDGRREHLRCRYPDTQVEVDRFEPREGGTWESAGISAHSGDRYRQSGRILRYDPPHLLVMTFQEDGWPAETMVTYRLSEYFGRTRLTLVHSGFERLPPARRLLTWTAYEIGRFKSLEPIRDLVEGRQPMVQHPLMIRKEIEIHAPIERVWGYIGTQEGSLARHRAENAPGRVEYQAEVLEPRPGGRYELRGIYEGVPFLITGQVLAYDPPAVLALSWREEGWPVETLVRFRLAGEDGKTRVTVIHNGFEHLPPELRGRELRGYEIGRVRGLEALRALAERAVIGGSGGAMSHQETPETWTVRKMIEIAAPATAVWPFVGTAEGLRTWWASSCRRLVLEPKVGGRFEIVVEFSRLYTIVGQVTAYDPPQRIAFTWRETDGDEGEWPADTLVAFTLNEREGRTVVTVEHSGFERLPEVYRRDELRSYERGWTDEEMERLRQLVLERVSAAPGT